MSPKPILLVLTLAMSALLASSAARAADSQGFALMRKLCIDTKADPKAALAVAEANGFMAPSEVARANILANLASLKLEGAELRWKPIAAAQPVLLVVGQKSGAVGDPFPTIATKINMCIVASAADPAAEDDMSKWANAGRDESVQQVPAFAFSGDTPHRSVFGMSKTEIAAAAKAGELQIAADQRQGGTTILFYGRNQPVVAPN